MISRPPFIAHRGKGRSDRKPPCRRNGLHAGRHRSKARRFCYSRRPWSTASSWGQAVLRRNEDAVDVELLPAIARSAATVVRVRAALYCANELSSVVILYVLQLSGTSPP
jgi:hypothetical protein